MSGRDEFYKLVAFRKCPNCGGELEKGYIDTSEGIAWHKDYHRFKFWAYEDILTREGFLGFPKIPSLRCKPCGIVISHYGYKRERKAKRHE